MGVYAQTAWGNYAERTHARKNAHAREKKYVHKFENCKLHLAKKENLHFI